MATSVVNAPARVGTQQRIYLDESGTLGYSGELFTIALVLVNDLPKLETCMLKNRSTQTEVKASQMKTAQKLALARTILEQNDIKVFFAKLDPSAAQISERKIDKEFLYDAMVAQALAYYLEHHAIPEKLPYRISMDMRSGLRESYEDMVSESIGNVLMQRADPLVTGLEVRFMDSRYSMGIQAADLFSNIYRIALTQPDSPCHSFLHKYEEEGRLHADFTFGLPQLADQMSQIAAELRNRVAGEQPAERSSSGAPKTSKPAPAPDEGAMHEETSAGNSRSSRRRRARANHREQESSEQPGTAKPKESAKSKESAAAAAPDAGATAPKVSAEHTGQDASAAHGSAAAEPAAVLPQTATTRRGRRKAASIAGSKHVSDTKTDHPSEAKESHAGDDAAQHAGATEPSVGPAEEPAQAPATKPAAASTKPAKAPSKTTSKAAKTSSKSSSKPSSKPETKAASNTASTPKTSSPSHASGRSAAKKKAAEVAQPATDTPSSDDESRSA